MQISVTIVFSLKQNWCENQRQQSKTNEFTILFKNPTQDTKL